MGNYAFVPPEYAWSTETAEISATLLFSFSASIVAVLCASFRRLMIRSAQITEVFSRAQEVAHLGSWEFDVEKDSLVWSDEVFRIFGLEPGEFAASYEAFLAAVHPEDRAAVDAAFSGSLRGGCSFYEIEHRIIRRSTGEVRTVHERCEHLRDSSGKVIRSTGVVHDITEQKRAEEALRLANEQLRDADRRKDDFLAILSHELRNPLAPIHNSLNILKRAPSSSAQGRRAREVLERQIDHMTRLVSDLLDVSRITRGKIQVQHELIDLRDVVSRTLEDHRSVFTTQGIELEDELPAQPIWVKGDGARLAQALGNLLHNSAKFTPAKGSVRVSLRLEDSRAAVRVEDTGSGIAPELFAHLFQPFAQPQGAPVHAGDGLGLGLALAKGLVELHGGEIEAFSAGPGQGTTITFRIPAAQAPRRAERAAVEPVRAHALRVLVIDDNIDAAESLQALLELDGHEVAVAFSGPEGLLLARSSEPDVVLCDIGLPGMDGYEVAQAFRGDEQLQEIPLVALTGYALDADRNKALELGFGWHLAKPPSLEAIEQVLAEVPERHAAPH